MTLTRRSLASLIAVAACLPFTAVAQEWPAKPIRIVVPFAAGGTSDILARSLADRLLNGVRKLEVALPGVKIPVRCTVSIGISRRCNERADWELCWAEADRALYAAKAEGRDRVMAAGAMPPPLRDAAPLRSPAPG